MKSLNERYQRQVTLRGFGEAAQEALLKAKVLVIGTGGLGCPVLQYLTAAGVGCIGIMDDDVVSLSNLHRQVLYDTMDIGKAKVEVAAEKLRRINPDCSITAYKIHLDKNNCLDIIKAYDVIVDCTDNFTSRYLINDACVLKGKPVVYGAVNRFEGQAAVFNVVSKDTTRTANYRDLFPEQPAQTEVMNCAEAGVLGVLPGIIGSMQANETIKLITGIGEPLVNQLLTYDSLNNNVNIFNYQPISQSVINAPQSEEEFLKMDYDGECLTGSNHFEITIEEFDTMLLENDWKIADVREFDELPAVNEFEHINIPLGELKSRLSELTKEKIIFFCQSGIRSLQAAAMAAAYFEHNNQCYSLRGGIVAWKKLHEKQMV
jgi:sulfur-carrier protein adenylyltransferase/sulfurtransferase